MRMHYLHYSLWLQELLKDRATLLGIRQEISRVPLYSPLKNKIWGNGREHARHVHARWRALKFTAERNTQLNM
jgi:hypothetical protein